MACAGRLGTAPSLCTGPAAPMRHSNVGEAAGRRPACAGPALGGDPAAGPGGRVQRAAAAAVAYCHEKSRKERQSVVVLPKTFVSW